MILSKIIMIPPASFKAAPARIMCIDAVSPTSCKPMALLEDVWIMIVNGSTNLLRKSARPILKTSNWMSHKVRPSARQAHTCLLWLPTSWPPEAGRRPPRCAAIRAASLASQMRIFNPQKIKAKMSNNRRRAADCHTTFLVPSARGARGRLNSVHPALWKAIACAAAFALATLYFSAATGRPATSASAAWVPYFAASAARRPAKRSNSFAVARNINTPVPKPNDLRINRKNLSYTSVMGNCRSAW